MPTADCLLSLPRLYRPRSSVEHFLVHSYKRMPSIYVDCVCCRGQKADIPLLFVAMGMSSSRDNIGHAYELIYTQTLRADENDLTLRQC